MQTSTGHSYSLTKADVARQRKNVHLRESREARKVFKDRVLKLKTKFEEIKNMLTCVKEEVKWIEENRPEAEGNEVFMKNLPKFAGENFKQLHLKVQFYEEQLELLNANKNSYNWPNRYAFSRANLCSSHSPTSYAHLYRLNYLVLPPPSAGTTFFNTVGGLKIGDGSMHSRENESYLKASRT